MARKSRIHFPGALYHVILRGNPEQDLFNTDDDRTYFYSLLAEGVERFNCKIHAFCLMTDHIHLAVQVGETPLSRLMQNITFRHTRWINRSQKRSGPLFRGRFKAILVDDNSFLLDLVRYIHLNPTRSGLGLDPKSYPWSSQKAYCGLEKIGWLTIEPVLTRFDSHERIAINRYQRFVVDALREGHRPEFQKGSGTDVRVLGNDNFVARVHQLVPDSTGPRPDLATVVDLIAEEYALNSEQLSAPGKERLAAEARAVAALISFEEKISTLSELGAQLNRAAATLSSAVTRLKKRMKNDRVLAEKVATIRTRIEKLHV
jgi:REP element-mobilizing transposase RayT